MAISRKKVIVRRFSPGVLSGYLPVSGMLRTNSLPAEMASLDLLDLAGRVQPVPLEGVKYVCFVRDFNLDDSVFPERLARKTFQGRPRTEGLWLRLTLKDEDVLEGLAPLDLSLVDGLLEDQGLQIVPPDTRGNTQRIFVPRAAIAGIQVVAVVTTPSRRQALQTPLQKHEQADLFSIELPPNARPH